MPKIFSPFPEKGSGASLAYTPLCPSLGHEGAGIRVPWLSAWFLMAVMKDGLLQTAICGLDKGMIHILGEISSGHSE